jgi:hypothetical protein
MAILLSSSSFAASKLFHKIQTLKHSIRRGMRANPNTCMKQFKYVQKNTGNYLTFFSSLPSTLACASVIKSCGTGEIRKDKIISEENKRKNLDQQKKARVLLQSKATKRVQCVETKHRCALLFYCLSFIFISRSSDSLIL